MNSHKQTVKSQPRPDTWNNVLLSTCAAAISERSFGYNLGGLG